MGNTYEKAVTGYRNLGISQADSFYDSSKYGNRVGVSTGNAFGTILNTPGVTSGLTGLWNTWGTPQAGSNGGNGSVQGNADYPYDL